MFILGCNFHIPAFIANNQVSIKTSLIMLLETGDANGCLLNFFGDSANMLEDSVKNIAPYFSNSPSFSFPLSFALTTVNKYRIKNGTDRFGLGRSPWIIEPVNIVLFTSGRLSDDKVILCLCC